ncbi:MAG TPA: DUF2786 domain-containing protein [Acidimicrobiales bacterium]|nr:DUF2786 domain-containing protein [Acidimicrobiales bacterium]
MTTTATFEKVKADVAEKVRKLLVQAEDPAATPEEAQTFTAKAQQLMTKYAIDLAMITDAERVDRVMERGWKIEGPYAAHKVSLVNAVSRANDCRAIYTPLDGGARYIEVVGFPTDVEWVETLSASLVFQLTVVLAAAMRVKPARVHGRTYAVGFVEGFVQEVSGRLHQARRDAVAAADAERRAGAGLDGSPFGPIGSRPDGRSVELVLVAKARQVEDEFKVRFPGARSVSRYTRLASWAGYGPGRDAGRRADLARGSVGTRRGLSA